MNSSMNNHAPKQIHSKFCKVCSGELSRHTMGFTSRFKGAPDSMAQLAQGKKLLPTSYFLTTVAKFECGDARYSWLNDVIAVGVGEQVGFNPTYTFFEVG